MGAVGAAEAAIGVASGIVIGVAGGTAIGVAGGAVVGTTGGAAVGIASRIGGAANNGVGVVTKRRIKAVSIAYWGIVVTGS